MGSGSSWHICELWMCQALPICLARVVTFDVATQTPPPFTAKETEALDRAASMGLLAQAGLEVVSLTLDSKTLVPYHPHPN